MKVSRIDRALRIVFVIGLLCIGLLLMNATIRNSRANDLAALQEQGRREFISAPL